ncbi:MAG: flavodoxin family protein [Candidatus Lokiarchaeota archaeon]|nr:flavodoxin family protein [Candidatus Lokiarchaeota archaeon]
MKVVMINGSTRGSKGNTQILLETVARALKEKQIDSEIVTLADKKLNPCKGCAACAGKNRCIQDDDINAIYQKMVEADGIVLGSPTYFGNVTSRIQMLVERTGYIARGNGNPFKGKVGAPVAVARRAGTTFVYAALNYFFGIAEMPIATSSYWNMAIGREPGAVSKDDEGIKTMTTLGENMADLLLKLHA